MNKNYEKFLKYKSNRDFLEAYHALQEMIDNDEISKEQAIIEF